MSLSSLIEIQTWARGGHRRSHLLVAIHRKVGSNSPEIQHRFVTHVNTAVSQLSRHVRVEGDNVHKRC